MKRAIQRRLSKCINFGAKRFKENFLVHLISPKTKFGISSKKYQSLSVFRTKYFQVTISSLLIIIQHNKDLAKDKSKSSWKV